MSNTKYKTKIRRLNKTLTEDIRGVSETSHVYYKSTSLHLTSRQIPKVLGIHSLLSVAGAPIYLLLIYQRKDKMERNALGGLISYVRPKDE